MLADLWFKIKKFFWVIKWKFYPHLAPKVALNPLLKYPPNLFCYCGSKKKAKLCCIPKEPEYLTFKHIQEAGLVEFVRNARRVKGAH
jgi:hypothetical protein